MTSESGQAPAEAANGDGFVMGGTPALPTASVSSVGGGGKAPAPSGGGNTPPPEHPLPVACDLT